MLKVGGVWTFPVHHNITQFALFHRLPSDIFCKPTVGIGVDAVNQSHFQRMQ
jgi:hypothetical protein